MKIFSDFPRENHGHGGHEHVVRRGVFGGKLSFKIMSAGSRLCTSQEKPPFLGPESRRSKLDHLTVRFDPALPLGRVVWINDRTQALSSESLLQLHFVQLRIELGSPRKELGRYVVAAVHASLLALLQLVDQLRKFTLETLELFDSGFCLATVDFPLARAETETKS